MLSFIIRRTLSMLATFIVVSIVIFLMMHSIPGGPFDGYDMPLPDNIKARLMADLGLDKPLWEQYLRYMWGVFRLDFGVPYQSPGETVMGLIAHAWVPSLVLGGLGVLIGAPLGILLGMAAALKRNSWIDYVASTIATLGLTIPVFVISTLLILVFAVWLKWTPASGWGEPKRWILPIAAYAAVPMATYARYARSAMLDTLNKPFVTVLRAKGLSERRIVFQHVLRNSAIPMITIFLPMFVGIATGSIFVEKIFRVPGLGAYFVSSIEKRDYPLEMALMLLISALFCISYLVSDILYALLNPRIRLGGKDQ
ncbi:ABC transporter permease [Kaistia geumhonensis]|uniref:ABC-type dipeptide/oligopeptide/nickel transport system permease component n=1 Tax=Kaistia geumhonensis TaxID=410839 RepID=A0ABU0M785_9HYPH|nr:ABC transporter permease [Kaistia geumhonensis]MCX5477957.1 ABC transporter permease [Kaistia geumhonensis]MDQ0516830.1 ABC-type dipeptide/oligopeptide/nickel transport system permease component [Kaistia geumhonensis]